MKSSRLLLSRMRLRDSTGKIKVQHAILDGLKEKLQKLVVSPDAVGSAIKSVTPGTIAPMKNRGKEVGVVYFRLTIPLASGSRGWKAIAFGAGARQEVFISTSKDIEREEMVKALTDCGLTPMDIDKLDEPEQDLGKLSSRNGRKKRHLGNVLNHSLLLVIFCCLLLVNLGEAIQVRQSWSNRRALICTPIVEPSTSSSTAAGIWAAERPFVWNSIDVGGRSFICRITAGKNAGGLLVHSPVDLTPELAAELKKIGGGVRVVIAPNFEHLRYSQQWAEAFPKADMWACPGLPDRMPEVKWNKEMMTESVDDYLDLVWFNCEKNPFTGKAFFNEVVFYYRPLKALFCSDVFWNYPSAPFPNYNDEMELSSPEPEVEVPLGSKAWKFGMDKVYLPFYKNLMTLGGKDKFEAAREKVLAWDIDVIVPCHGDVLRGRDLCKRVLAEHLK